MTQIMLYTGGGVSLSPVYVDGRTETNYVRLVADEGKHLECGGRMAACVDVLKSDAMAWLEVEGDIFDTSDHIPAWDVTQAEYIHEGDRVSRDGVIYRCISGHYAAWNKQPPNEDYWEIAY